MRRPNQRQEEAQYRNLYDLLGADAVDLQEQNLLNDYCGTFGTPTPKAPGTMHLVEKVFDGGSDASTWTCPSLSDFQDAFAEP